MYFVIISASMYLPIKWFTVSLWYVDYDTVNDSYSPTPPPPLSPFSSSVFSQREAPVGMCLHIPHDSLSNKATWHMEGESTSLLKVGRHVIWHESEILRRWKNNFTAGNISAVAIRTGFTFQLTLVAHTMHWCLWIWLWQVIVAANHHCINLIFIQIKFNVGKSVSMRKLYLIDLIKSTSGYITLSTFDIRMKEILRQGTQNHTIHSVCCSVMSGKPHMALFWLSLS